MRRTVARSLYLVPLDLAARTIRALAVAIACVGILSGAQAAAQETLADLRQDLTILYVEIQKLKRELSTTGGTSVQAQGGSTLDRVNAIEAELQRLTGRTEELSNRVDRIVADGTNRIGDLEFRLVELEGGDISQLGETSTLGGETETAAVRSLGPVEVGTQLAVGEQADFNKAKEAFDAGSYETAVIQFDEFSQTYTGGPLTMEAHFWRGKSLAALGETSAAAKAYLEAYTGDPEGILAPDALLELGLALDVLGASTEACTMLGEVQTKFPGSAAADEATEVWSNIGCT